MKKLFITAFVLFALGSQVFAQEDYKITKSSGKLQINLGQVTVEGHAGNEIIFSSKSGTYKEDDRAKGLRSINSLGLEDNTGLGINVTEKDGVIEVNQLKKINPPDVKILVPKGFIVAVTHPSQYVGKAIFKNIENEIEVSATYNSIELENVTGPATVKSVYGSVDAIFNQNVKGPLSIVSIYGHVDVTLPKAIKADLKMSTSYGEIFVSPDFEIDIEKKEGDMVRYNNDHVDGKVNGGGMNISLRSDYGKIYLRTK